MPPSTASVSLPAVGSAVTIVPQASGPPACVTGVHPAAALFPLMHGGELELLVADIAQNGLREPIMLYDGQILDGRNRLHACELAQVPPRFIEWDGDGGSPLSFVLSRNLHRRHLDESQRSLIAVRAKEMFKKEAAERHRAGRFGARPKHPPDGSGDMQKSRDSTVCADLHRPSPSNDQAGAALNVSARLVATATRVLDAGDAQLIEAVRLGEVSVSDAATILHLPHDQQREAVTQVRSGDARTVRQAVRQLAGAAPDEAAQPAVSQRELRRACQRFSAGYEKLCREIDVAARYCGGPNDHTRRAHESLAAAQRAMHDCLADFGGPVRPK